MAITSISPTHTTPIHEGIGGYRGGSGRNGFGGPGGDPRRESPRRPVPARACHVGMWMAIAGIMMLFAAFTSAMVVRRGISYDWVATALPHVLYLNTLLLIASSFTLELARRSLAADDGDRFARWLYVTVILGLGFVAGQLLAWRELASHGVYLSTNPSSSFFYLLTAAHGLHLLGGIAALFYLVFQVRRLVQKLRRRVAVDVTALYWHFMDGLWLYILILLVARS
ncbi:MAG TPA: cytochrome c oxidase subunit 3 [Candidatus Sulfotelmatobacter sp.]|nr:cytochrome c oxidase subunit 3 [Candidatus Sulfotelmatobacter sp.]